MERPGRNVPGTDQGAVPVDFHSTIGFGTRTELIAGRKNNWNIRAVLNPSL
jgi:hypothetical protein